MYGQKDRVEANKRLQKYEILLGCGLLPLLALYIAAIVQGKQGLMLAVLLAAFVWTVLIGDLLLLPAWRYVRFLREMGAGLRRSLDCVLDFLEEKAQMQDGVCVYALQVHIPESGETRLFYVNIHKAELLPKAGETLRLIGYGRHVVDFERI